MKEICVLTNNNDNIEGTIIFTKINKNLIEIDIEISGLKPGLHGIHIHRSGDLRKGCDSVCDHFNPFNVNHGNINDNKYNRHVGDLGNIRANNNGIVKIKILDKLITLSGKCNIIGRSIVIHELCDDLGIGGLNEQGQIVNMTTYNESIKTGNSGKRIACGVIGWL
jgi:Cu-Zn family superoxide dismutase